MTKILMVVGGLGMALKGQEKRQGELEIRGKIKTIQTRALLKSARIYEIIKT